MKYHVRINKLHAIERTWLLKATKSNVLFLNDQQLHVRTSYQWLLFYNYRYCCIFIINGNLSFNVTLDICIQFKASRFGYFVSYILRGIETFKFMNAFWWNEKWCKFSFKKRLLMEFYNYLFLLMLVDFTKIIYS